MEFDKNSLSSNKNVAIPNDRRVGLIFDERMCEHHAPYDKDHPECPGRIRAIWDRLNSSGLTKRCIILNAKDAEDKHLALVHTKKHIDLIKNINYISSDFKRRKIAAKYDSIYFNKGSSKAAYLAAGSVIEVAEKVAKGELNSAFAIVRPPGHHAEHDQPMGFCLHNNVAIATSYLLNERRDLDINKILIVDWDVHHGNGTQKMFYDDPRALVFSVHRYDNAMFFPCTHDGSYIMTGEDQGAGYNINVPWESGECGDADYNAVWDQILIPVAKEYNPDLIIISAGFDAAIGDPLGGCRVSPHGFSILLEKLMKFAGGKIVMALEGGYNLKSIANSAHACVEVLLQGKRITGSLEAKPFKSTLSLIEEVRQILSTYWPMFAAKSPDKVISRTSPVETSTIAVTQISDAESNLNSKQQVEEAISELTRLRKTGGDPNRFSDKGTSTISVSQILDANSNSNSNPQVEEARSELTRMRITGRDPNRCSDKGPTTGKEGILNHLDLSDFLDIQADQLLCNETLHKKISPDEEVLECGWLSHVESDTTEGIKEAIASGTGRGRGKEGMSTLLSMLTDQPQVPLKAIVHHDPSASVPVQDTSFVEKGGQSGAATSPSLADMLFPSVPGESSHQKPIEVDSLPSPPSRPVVCTLPVGDLTSSSSFPSHLLVDDWRVSGDISQSTAHIPPPSWAAFGEACHPDLHDWMVREEGEDFYGYMFKHSARLFASSFQALVRHRNFEAARLTTEKVASEKKEECARLSAAYEVSEAARLAAEKALFDKVEECGRLSVACKAQGEQLVGKDVELADARRDFELLREEVDHLFHSEQLFHGGKMLRKLESGVALEVVKEELKFFASSHGLDFDVYYELSSTDT